MSVHIYIYTYMCIYVYTFSHTCMGLCVNTYMYNLFMICKCIDLRTKRMLFYSNTFFSNLHISSVNIYSFQGVISLSFEHHVHI